MHRRIVFAVSTVLFVLLAVLAVVMTDLHDRSFPQSIGAHTSVSIDISDSVMDNSEAFRELGAISDQLDLGLVKVAPDLSGDQNGRVFVVVGSANGFLPRVPLFNDRDAQVRGSEALATSYATGQYLITSEGARVDEFRRWLDGKSFTTKWNDDSATGTLSALLMQPSFGVTVLAAIALLVSLVLYWLSVKARGRSLRVLAGTPTGRIQFEDIVGLLIPIALAAIVCAGAAIAYVGLSQGWVFVPFVASTLVLLDGLVISSTLVCAIVMSMVAIPSTKMLAARTPEIAGLQRAAVVLKVLTFALVIATLAPAVSLLTQSRDIASQQAQWRSLSDQVSIGISAAIGESGFQQASHPLAKLVKDAEAKDAAAMSYSWPSDLIARSGDDAGNYQSVALVNQKWLDLMGITVSPAGVKPSLPTNRTLEQLPGGKAPAPIEKWLDPSLALWARESGKATQLLDSFKVYQYNGKAHIPMATAGGGGSLEFLDHALIIVTPHLYESFNDDFLGSIISTSNIVFSGLGPTQALISTYGLRDVTTPRYVAEEGVLAAQYTAYFAWLQGFALIALLVALAVAACVSAFIVAVVKSHRDFPLALAGTSWRDILAGRVMKDWAMFALATGLILLVRGFNGWALISVAALVAACLAPLTHFIAARWSFQNVAQRRA